MELAKGPETAIAGRRSPTWRCSTTRSRADHAVSGSALRCRMARPDQRRIRAPADGPGPRFQRCGLRLRRGIFYLGYLLFEIPSNLLLERIGARKTFARITILWGFTSMATLLVKTAGWFYFMRFLLGAFEAGLLPGAVLYLTYWFPRRRRARMTGLFLAAIPIAGVLGGPLSGLIMGSMGGRLGLANWQWLFLLEGHSVGDARVARRLRSSQTNPSQAGWLTEARATRSDRRSRSRQPRGRATAAWLDARTDESAGVAAHGHSVLPHQRQSNSWILGPDDHPGLGVNDDRDNRFAVRRAEHHAR